MSSAVPSPDFVPLDGARLVRTSEPSEADALQDCLIKDLISGEPIEVRPPHPWPVEACRKMAYVSIGTWKIRTIYSRRNDWWDRLRAAATPEEKLTCERMINAFGEALGLHQHELGAKIAAQNPYLDADFGSRAEDLEKRAVDKWR